MCDPPTESHYESHFSALFKTSMLGRKGSALELMKRLELFINLKIPEAQKRPIVMALMCTDDLIVVAVHDTSTVKLRARCFSHPAPTDEVMIGKPDTAKGTIINAFVFLCLTHTPSDWLNNELLYHVRITLGPIAMPSGIGIVQSLLKRRSGKIMHQVYSVKEPGTDHGDIPTLEK